MGRDKPKKYDKMGYFEKEDWKAREAKKRGIQGIEYRDYRGNTQTHVNEKALKEAIRNDFDYRTSAQHMDGAKGNGKFNDFTNYERAAVKLHKQAGNEGSYSSNKDITGVTNNLVRDANNFLMNKIDGMTAKEQQAQAESGVADPASTQLQDARDTVDELGNKEYDIFAANINNGDNQNQRDQASEAFLGKYKLDLADKKGISPVLPA